MEELVTSFWKDRNVFVSGGLGLLGGWLVQSLVEQGANVIALMRDWTPASMLLRDGLARQITLVHGELQDYEVVLRALNEYEVDTIFHLGAQTIVGTAARSPLSTFESNIRGTWTLLEAARQCGGRVQRIVVASSDKAYGDQEKLPYTEDTPLQGRFPYDVSKSCTDLISLSYFHSYALPVAVTRCGNLFGGGDLNWNRLVPGTIRSLLKGEAPVIRSDGLYVRDYFYVRDAVAAYMRLAERMEEDGLGGQAFNFGTETPLSVIEMVDRILALMGGGALRPVILNEASREIRRQYLDCAKARALLAWKPLYTLEQALEETIAWYAAQLGAPGVSADGAAQDDDVRRAAGGRLHVVHA